MIVRLNGSSVAAALAATLALALALGLGVAAPPQAAMTTIAMRPSVAKVRRMRSSLDSLDICRVDSGVGTPLDETVLEPGHGELGGQRDDGQDEHRGEHAVGVEGRLRGSDHEPDPMDRTEVLAHDRPDEREPEARVQAREDPRQRGG